MSLELEFLVMGKAIFERFLAPVERGHALPLLPVVPVVRGDGRPL
jgi:hypothetical protein